MPGWDVAQMRASGFVVSAEGVVQEQGGVLQLGEVAWVPCLNFQGGEQRL